MGSDHRRLFDISRTVRESSAVFPGDTPFTRRWVMRMDGGCSCNVSTVNMTVHVGTHADAPFHFQPGGATIDAVDLTAYLGSCRVITTKRPDALHADDLAGVDFHADPRILVRSSDHMRDDEWRDHFLHCSVEAAELLARGGARLLGVETPSMDHSSSKTLAAHHILAGGGIALLEGLDLSAVPDGRYELIALPVKFGGADAAPVRAILRTL